MTIDDKKKRLTEITACTSIIDLVTTPATSSATGAEIKELFKDKDTVINVYGYYTDIGESIEDDNRKYIINLISLKDFSEIYAMTEEDALEIGSLKK